VSRRRVLLDENISVRLRRHLPSVEAATVEHLGWKGVRNGELVARARDGGFDVLVTADRALALTPRSWAPLACVYVRGNRADLLLDAAADIDRACREALPGQVVLVRP